MASNEICKTYEQLFLNLATFFEIDKHLRIHKACKQHLFFHSMVYWSIAPQMEHSFRF